MQGKFWPIAVVTLCLLLLAGVIGQVAGSFTDSETSVGNSFEAWTSTLWLQTTRADFEAGIPSQADTRSSPGDVGLARANRIFAFQGGSASFWAYGIPANSWTSVNTAPNTVGAGGALAYDGVQYIYAFRGANSRTFWRYDITNNTWLARANTPAGGAVGAGGALAYDGVQYIYAFRGNASTTFWRYDTSSNTWATMAPAPLAVAAGGTLAYDGLRYIYAFRGSNRTDFWRYDTALNSWAARATAPGRVGAGGSLAYDGSQYAYAFQGNNRAFWRYDTIGNSWVAMTSAPARVGAGGALAYAGSGYIYAFRGANSSAFWRYDVLGNSWTSMTVASGGVGNGGALAFVAASTYVTWATIASQVRDTGRAGARWDALIWDETLPLTTDTTFEVRVSDTLFAAGDLTPAWTLVGGTSPLTSGLPAGRYMQWRATLITSDTSVTPLLHEVRLYHH